MTASLAGDRADPASHWSIAMPILDSLIQTLGAVGTLMAAVVIVSVFFTVAYML